MSKNTKMIHLLNFRLKVTLSDTRVMTGEMLAFDKYMNLVLADCEEFRRIKPKQRASGAAAQEREQKRMLGLVVLRGETIITMSIDAPPPPSLKGQKARFLQPQFPEVAAPAGRGMPVAPAGSAGLMGPVRGIGGPAPGMMLLMPPSAVAPPPSFVFGQHMPPPGVIPPPGPGVPPAGFPPAKMRPPPFGMPPPPTPFGAPPLGITPFGFRPMSQPGVPLPGVTAPGVTAPGVPPPGVPPGVLPPGFRLGVAPFALLPGFRPGPPPPG
ncbi:hypothetical protein BGW39_005212 [Mortierella sp. 14UC]|nr:hypothetical protein BGW39_005212 [Mortierella sp. 14UC]